MEFLRLEKVGQGEYLKQYNLYYKNKIEKIKKFEIVSKHELEAESQIGEKADGVVMIVTVGEKLLLLKEFRMGVNSLIYNLPAGMWEAGESIEECAARELYEETGLYIKEIKDILPPSYAAVDITDASSIVVLLEAEGEFSDHTTADEEITPVLLTKKELKKLLMTKKFSARAQIAAFFWAQIG